MTQSVGIATVYPDLETLFRTYLLVSNLNSRHIITEAEALTFLPQPAPSKRILNIILALNKLHKDGDLSPLQIDEIKKLSIFPIVKTPENEPYDNLTSVDSVKPWLIADKAHFRQHFRGVAPVLAFEPELIFRIRRLLCALGLEDRFLSKLATSVTETQGDVTPSKRLTMEYRERAKHLFRSVPFSWHCTHPLTFRAGLFQTTRTT